MFSDMFNYPVLSIEECERISVSDLQHKYSKSTEIERLNIYFSLEATVFHYEKSEGHGAVLGHLCYLLAYYVFVLLTPPGSEIISLKYISLAISFEDKDEYHMLKKEIIEGN